MAFPLWPWPTTFVYSLGIFPTVFRRHFVSHSVPDGFLIFHRPFNPIRPDALSITLSYQLSPNVLYERVGTGNSVYPSGPRAAAISYLFHHFYWCLELKKKSAFATISAVVLWILISRFALNQNNSRYLYNFLNCIHNLLWKQWFKISEPQAVVCVRHNIQNMI